MERVRRSSADRGVLKSAELPEAVWSWRAEETIAISVCCCGAEDELTGGLRT
jgi:hypothetical protein